jgi:hypothetical protein
MAPSSTEPQLPHSEELEIVGLNDGLAVSFYNKFFNTGFSNHFRVEIKIIPQNTKTMVR